MEYRIIKSPSKSTLQIIMKRTSLNIEMNPDEIHAIGLVQGRMIDMICAVDIAEKSAGVTVSDVKGSCPQNLIMIGIFGDTSSVESAISEIKSNFEKGSKLC